MDFILSTIAFWRSGRAVKANQINPVGGGISPPPFSFVMGGLGDIRRRYMGH